MTRRIIAQYFGISEEEPEDWIILGAKKKKKKKELPKGWTEDSAKKYWKTVDESHTKCVEGLEGKSEVDNPHALCNWLKTKSKKKKN